MGRQRRQAALRRRSDLLAGKGGAVLLEGLTGYGKDRLLSEVVARAEEPGLSVARAVVRKTGSTVVSGVLDSLALGCAPVGCVGGLASGPRSSGPRPMRPWPFQSCCPLSLQSYLGQPQRPIAVPPIFDLFAQELFAAQPRACVVPVRSAAAL